MNREEAKAKIEALVNKFAEHSEEYHAPGYNEAQTRQDFINPFFKALGWDIDNEKADSEAYREVIYEDTVVVKGKAKTPDYGFRLAGSGSKRLFYVEAKKPSVAIQFNKDAAYQLRRYGSSAQAGVSVLTNFEDFIVYDCSRVPYVDDSPAVARLKHIHFKNYAAEFDFIYDTFSHEAVTKGRFDTYIKESASKKGTDTLDKRFVQSLDKWRKYLATNIAINNKALAEEQINYAVQLTIDRLIFLRFCEDRFVEPYGQLQKAVSKGSLYKNLFDLFKQADDKYNSGLFDFDKDKITPTLNVDNKVIKSVIEELYYPKCNYDFGVMPVEVIGNAYEQFLGKVITLNAAHTATIKDKPEVRKAGGVYYTPQYIVNYIVKNTVGKLIEGKKPKEIEKIKIVDPACGSGSFLVGAFEFLLNYHIEWYHKNGYAAKKGKDNPFTPQGALTTREKKRILLANIYGVDIDANAVEVTKLSLLLKCMEGETDASIKQQVTLFNERVLPDLDNNIKSGNSLIDTDFYDSEIDLGFEKKIKPFNWQKQFPQVFKQGGFDAVIGNPPYVQPIILDKESQKYLLNHFKANTDLYSIFIERSLSLLKENMHFGFIVPSLFLKGVRYENLRNVINSNCNKVDIKEYGDGVFNNVQMPTCIILFLKGKTKKAIDFFENKNHKLFFKTKTVLLSEISETRRGLEIGRDKISTTGAIKCITGGNIDRYLIKDTQYISQETFNLFSKDDNVFTSHRIIIRETGDRFFATMEDRGVLTTRSIYNTKIINKKYSPEFLLSIINSNLFKFYFHQFISPDTRIFPKIRIAQLKELPIPTEVSLSLAKETERHVDLLLKLNEELKAEKLPDKIDQIKQRIEHSEDKINQLVYELYGLTKEEIAIVEESIKK